MCTTQELNHSSSEGVGGRCSFGDSGKLKLNIITYNQDSLEVELINCQYIHQRHYRLNLLLGSICCYGTYRALATFTKDGIGFKIIPADVVFLILQMSLVYFMCQLIDREKFQFCRDFGLQLQTCRFPSRKSNVFIPRNHIFDVCINEVIEDLTVYYILILRTKSALFNKKPIIPIFHSLKPPISLIEVVYKHLSNMLNEVQN